MPFMPINATSPLLGYQYPVGHQHPAPADYPTLQEISDFVKGISLQGISDFVKEALSTHSPQYNVRLDQTAGDKVDNAVECIVHHGVGKPAASVAKAVYSASEALCGRSVTTVKGFIGTALAHVIAAVVRLVGGIIGVAVTVTVGLLCYIALALYMCLIRLALFIFAPAAMHRLDLMFGLEQQQVPQVPVAVALTNPASAA